MSALCVQCGMNFGRRPDFDPIPRLEMDLLDIHASLLWTPFSGLPEG